MTSKPAQPQVPTRAAVLLRLGGLALGVACGFVTVALVVPGSPHGLRDLILGVGPAAAVAFLVAGALLTLALFPFPVLAAASGLTFGAVPGGGLAIAAETAGALAALGIGRRLGARSLASIGGPRFRPSSMVWVGEGSSRCSTHAPSPVSRAESRTTRSA